MTTATASPLQINRAYYEAHADDFCQRTEDVAMDGAYGPFLRLLPNGAHLLDAGCGSGRDAAAFLSRGYKVTAIDASPAMVHAAQRRGIRAKVQTFERMNFNAQFDGVWACASLLHVSHAEMPAVLRRFARALKHQGVLFASLKAGRGERVSPDGRFFSYFNVGEFSELLLREGMFEIVKTWQNNDPDSSGTVRSWLNFLARRVG